MQSQVRTVSETYTKVDIRKVLECFASDLAMLALRTKTMDAQWAINTAYDITLMAIEECLAAVNVQLFDARGIRIAAHAYQVNGAGNWDQDRPGDNNWPSTPGGEIVVIVAYSDIAKADSLKRSGKLLRSWGPTSLDTDYSSMKVGGSKQYSSGSYGWSRKSYGVY